MKREGVRYPVTEAERDLLRRLLVSEDDDDPLTEFRPGGWMVGTERVHAPLCWRLIRHGLIKSDSLDPPRQGDCKYWYVNETGRQVAEDPTFIPWAVRMFNGEKGPFTS